MRWRKSIDLAERLAFWRVRPRVVITIRVDTTDFDLALARVQAGLQLLGDVVVVVDGEAADLLIDLGTMADRIEA